MKDIKIAKKYLARRDMSAGRVSTLKKTARYKRIAVGSLNTVKAVEAIKLKNNKRFKRSRNPASSRTSNSVQYPIRPLPVQFRRIVHGYSSYL